MLPTKTILFDGDCSFCNFWVRFVTKRDPKKQFEFISLQSDKGEMIRKQYKISKELDSVILIENNQAYIKSTAVLKIIKRFKFPWFLGYIFVIIPRFLSYWIYDLVARNRHVIFKENNSCELPHK